MEDVFHIYKCDRCNKKTPTYNTIIRCAISYIRIKLKFLSLNALLEKQYCFHCSSNRTSYMGYWSTTGSTSSAALHRILWILCCTDELRTHELNSCSRRSLKIHGEIWIEVYLEHYDKRDILYEVHHTPHPADIEHLLHSVYEYNSSISVGREAK